MLETTRLLRDLVALPSINPMGRALQGPEIYEHQVTGYLEETFRGLDVPFARQSVAPLRDNILAMHEPADAAVTLVFEVHQDTVPVDNMTIDPFGAQIEAGRLYGRGACDIKGGMAAMLAAFGRLVREKPRSARVVLACTVDEEFSFLGVQRLAQTSLAGSRGGPVWAVVAEPTQLHIVNAHKGTAAWRLSTRGRACHSSRPELGVNAIYAMSQLLPWIERYAEHLRATRVDERLGPATLSVGRIEGGASVNTVPDRCQIEIDRRLLPGENAEAAPDELVAYLREHVAASVAFDCMPAKRALPALSSAGSEDLVARLGAAIDRVVGKHEVQAVPYGTDASTLANAGTPSVVFGPGDIGRAHTSDEWVPLEEVEQASEILFRLATDCSE